MPSATTFRLSLFGCPGLVQNSPKWRYLFLPAPRATPRIFGRGPMWGRFPATLFIGDVLLLTQQCLRFGWVLLCEAAQGQHKSAHNSLNTTWTTHGGTPPSGLNLKTTALGCQLPLADIRSTFSSTTIPSANSTLTPAPQLPAARFSSPASRAQPRHVRQCKVLPPRHPRSRHHTTCRVASTASSGS